MGFHAITWSTSLYRNAKVFKGKDWNASQVYEESKLKVAILARAKWPLEYGSVLNIYKNTTFGLVMRKVGKDRLMEG